ncbi:MAG TPA: hypothetical protein VJ717_03410 [Gemmatimonadaceae bacterium]|nr:hypothetical protein [Gemmatimonadaceae bacterium]
MSHINRYSLLRCSFAALTLGIAAVANAQRPHPTPVPLLPVDWGTSADTVLQRAAAAGWSFLTIDEDGDYAFRATMDGEEALVFATIGEKGLTRLLVSVAPHVDPEATFKRLGDTLRTYFGPAALTTYDEEVRPAPWMLAATAWEGVIMGLRRDRRILILFTCPAATPQLPLARRRDPIT